MESEDKQPSIIERFLATPWPLLAITTLFIVLNVLFAEKTPANMGLGWDGFRYARITTFGLASPEIDSYTVFRVLPSLLLYTLFHWFSISFSPANIILGFEIINATCVLGTVFFVKGIFDKYEVPMPLQATGFVLLLCNYFSLKFNFYYPVLTDTAGFFLGTAVLYFHLQRQTINLLLASLIAAFTWPVAFMMGFILLLFPVRETEEEAVSPKLFYATLVASGLIAAGILHYLVKMKGDFIDIAYATPIDPHLLVFSIAAAVITYCGWAMPLLNAQFLRISFIKNSFTITSVSLAATLLLLTIGLRMLFPHVAPSSYTTFSHLLKIHWIFSIAKPFITLVSHFNFFGVLIPLVILFWKPLCSYSSRWGLGIPLAICANLMLFGMKSESRVLVNLFPWLVVLLTLTLSRYSFSSFFYAAVVIINLLVSKYWLIIDEEHMTGEMLTAKNMIGWPWQKFYMNFGIYMDEKTWLILLGALILTLLCFTLLLWKIEIRKPNLIFTPRYTFNNQ